MHIVVLLKWLKQNDPLAQDDKLSPSLLVGDELYIDSEGL